VVSVDLSADVGEDDAEDDGSEELALFDVVTSASVACGFHAGGPGTMRRAVAAAARRGVVVGAHPSYADRDGFGRRPLDVHPGQVADEVVYQVGALDAVARAAGTRVRYVKPHGALYHRLVHDEHCARAVAEALRALGDLALVVAPGSVVLEVGAALGVAVVAEAFADRAYLPDGRLAPRSDPGAVLSDPTEVARRALSLALDGRVTALDGSEVSVAASTICVHGDTPGARTLAAVVRSTLEDAGVTVTAFAS